VAANESKLAERAMESFGQVSVVVGLEMGMEANCSRKSTGG